MQKTQPFKDFCLTAITFGSNDPNQCFLGNPSNLKFFNFLLVFTRIYIFIKGK